MYFEQWEKSQQKKRWQIILGVFAIVIFGAVIFQIHSVKADENKNNAAYEAKMPDVLVLNYHKVANMHHSLAIRPADFEEQLLYLKKAGYQTITPAELAANIENGTPLPEKPLLITFDDGYEDNYQNAYPLLKKYGFKATIFVVTGFMDKNPQYLTWKQAKELEANGISIESHTVTHRSMTELNYEQLKKELVDSKKDIEDHLQKKVLFIAYPTGTYNLQIAEMVKEAGYTGAFTIKYGNVDSGSNIYAMERMPVFQTEHTYKSFRERLQYLPSFTDLSWKKN